MTIGNALRLPALAFIATMQTVHLVEESALRDIGAANEDRHELSAVSLLQSLEVTPAAVVQQPAQADPSSHVAVADNDVWDRMRAGFAIKNGDKSSVQAQISAFRKQAYFVEQILRRSEPYLPHILARVEERGLPTELALLPVIESAFDPFARSPAGAAGIWQFMPATADELDLQRDWWYDGRRDIVAATEAALDYLTALQRRYDGDWQLALAAYNAGSARVNQAIRNNRSQGKPADFRHLQLPGETRDYVPKLIALRALITNPGAYGITLPELAGSAYFSAVDTGGPLDLQVAARLAGTTLDELQRLNPGLTRSVTPPEGSHRLLVPRRTLKRFCERLAQLPPERRVQSIRYRVRPGDTLSVIAQNSRTTVARLRKINQLESSRIIAGSVLIVPVASREVDVNIALQESVANG